MDLPTFVKLVAEMRKTQRLYFQTRSPQVLNESKSLEKKVDLAVKELLTTEKQPELW